MALEVRFHSLFLGIFSDPNHGNGTRTGTVRSDSGPSLGLTSGAITTFIQVHGSVKRFVSYQPLSCGWVGFYSGRQFKIQINANEVPVWKVAAPRGTGLRMGCSWSPGLTLMHRWCPGSRARGAWPGPWGASLPALGKHGAHGQLDEGGGAGEHGELQAAMGSGLGGWLGEQ